MKILLADDHQMFIDGISHILEKQGYEVLGSAKNGWEVFNIIQQQEEPAAVILDLKMPDLDGVEVAKKLRKHWPRVKILVVTTYDEPGYVYEVWKIGIDGYLLKDADEKQLIEALQAIMEGKPFFDERIAQIIMSGLNGLKNKSTSLSAREMDIIKLIADQKTTVEIADQLFLSKHTIETHRRNILLKLGLKNSVGLIKHAMKMGWIE